MFPSTAGRRRLVLLISRTAAAGSANTPHPHPQAISLSRHYSSSPLAAAPDPDPSSTVSYLVASCGLSPAAARKTSRWFRISSAAKADAALALLRRRGFSDADIARVVPVAPALLYVDPDKVTRPKLDLFASLGIPVAPLVRVPSLLLSSLHNHLAPRVDFLRGVLGSDANIRTAVCRNPFALRFDLDNTMRPAVEALRRGGLAEEAVSKLLVTRLGVLGMEPNRIAGIFEDLESLGLPATDSRFCYGFVSLSRNKREVWPQRIEIYLNFGLSKAEVVKAFRTQPTILDLSEEKIRQKLRFFRDDAKVALADVIAMPVILALSLEKNILPRCAVLAVLMKEGKIRRHKNMLHTVMKDATRNKSSVYSISTAFSCNTKKFSECFVKRYEKDVPDVVKAYEGKIIFNGFTNQDVNVMP